MTGPTPEEPGQDTPTPPYEGRTTEAAGPDEPDEREQRFAGVHPGSRTESLTDPSDTPGGRTASPADEQPAEDEIQTRPTDPGVGPAHYAGTPRGEDVADDSEAGRQDAGTTGADRPAGTSDARDATSVNPQSDEDSPS
jgi:hypothetical protein